MLLSQFVVIKIMHFLQGNFFHEKKQSGKLWDLLQVWVQPAVMAFVLVIQLLFCNLSGNDDHMFSKYLRVQISLFSGVWDLQLDCLWPGLLPDVPGVQQHSPRATVITSLSISYSDHITLQWWHYSTVITSLSSDNITPQWSHHSLEGGAVMRSLSVPDFRAFY